MAAAANKTETITHTLRIANFSMLIVLENDIPTYSGGGHQQECRLLQ